MSNLPKNPVMLLSVVNTELRDKYKSLLELSKNYNIDPKDLEKQLEVIDYHYDNNLNQFK